jgi:hypothetical protein
MRLSHHVTSSAVVAGILYLFFKSWSMTLSCFLSGIFIDVDHIFDYIREKGFPFKVNDFFKAIYEGELTRWTLVLHSWELLFLLSMIAWLTNWNPWITGIFIGFGHHLILDKFFNGERLCTYSFLWRWKHNFHYEKILQNDARKKMQKSCPCPCRRHNVT